MQHWVITETRLRRVHNQHLHLKFRGQTDEVGRETEPREESRSLEERALTRLDGALEDDAELLHELYSVRNCLFAHV